MTIPAWLPLLRPTISPPVRESTRRSPTWSASLRSIQRASKSAKSWTVNSDPTTLMPLRAIVCPSASPGRDGPFPTSPPEGGRCTLPLGEFKVHPLGSMARERRGHSLFGAEGLLCGSLEQTVKGRAPYQNGLSAAGGQRRHRRTVSQSLLLSPQRMSAERKQT